MKKTFLSILAILVVSTNLWANQAPVVSNVSVSVRADDSKLVDISYDLADPDGDNCTVWVFATNNGGTNWNVPVFTLIGDAGAAIVPGAGKRIVWDAGNDYAGGSGTFKIKVVADDGKSDDLCLVPAGSYPVDGGSTHVFVPTYFIGKYEVTNEEYAEFLNAADPSGTYWSSSMEIGKDGAYYTAVTGKEKRPVRYVSFDDAIVYCNWKSSVTGMQFDLPSKYQWQKAAAWRPTNQMFYRYAIQSDSISQVQANYWSSSYWLGRTADVGSYPNKSYYGSMT